MDKFEEYKKTDEYKQIDGLSHAIVNLLDNSDMPEDFKIQAMSRTFGYQLAELLYRAGEEAFNLELHKHLSIWQSSSHNYVEAKKTMEKAWINK